MLFLSKTDENNLETLFLRGSPHFNYPPIFEQVFLDHPLCSNFKNKIPHPNFRGWGGGWGGNYYNELLLLSIIIIGARINVNTNDITFNIEKCKKNP